MAGSHTGTQDSARDARDELERLLADAPGLAAILPPGFVDVAERYVYLLLVANRRTNLTRVVDPREVARFHLLDSLAALPLIDAAGIANVVDIGSGGGLPAIPLAIARPELRWLLVESVAKKAEALRGFVAELRLAGVDIADRRAETIGADPAHRGQHDLVTARACAPLPVLVELAMPLLRPGGTLLAWKGPLLPTDEEVRRGALAAAQLGGGRPRLQPSGAVALGGHLFVVIRKEGPTPDRFPRRPGVAERRPLA